MFKQICRLLLHNPSNDQVELVLQQWRRNDVHRDVKITILRLANRLLLTELHGALAWRILDAAINVPLYFALVELRPCVLHDTHTFAPGSQSGSLGLYHRRCTRFDLDEAQGALRQATVPDPDRFPFPSGGTLC